MGLVVTPVLKGKEKEWKAWAEKLRGERKKDFDDFNKRFGLTRHDAWAVETPNGLLAVVLHEGPGADSFMHDVMVSDNPFALEMKKILTEFHGIDMSSPPPGPMPVKVV